VCNGITGFKGGCRRGSFEFKKAAELSSIIIWTVVVSINYIAQKWIFLTQPSVIDLIGISSGIVKLVRVRILFAASFDAMSGIAKCGLIPIFLFFCLRL
jgi:hypothetical protein